MKHMMNSMMTWGELADRRTSLKVNLSTGLMDGLSRSKRIMMMLNIVETSTEYVQASNIYVN